LKPKVKAFFIKFVKVNAVFIAAIVTQILIIIIWYIDWLPYLWLNLLGCILVMGIALLLQFFTLSIDENSVK